MLLFALRHGERADKAPTNRVYNLSLDPCLTEVGLAQAEKTAETICEVIKDLSDVHIVSSPFLRCLETASKLALKLGLPVHVEEGFGELLDFGFNDEVMDNLDFKLRKLDLERQLGLSLVENNHIVRANYIESDAEGAIRVRHVWNEYLNRFGTAQAIVVVSHLFVVDTLNDIWIGEQVSGYDSGYCKLTICKYDGNYSLIRAPSSDYN
jgi:broad specificity phosphatase PhoE